MRVPAAVTAAVAALLLLAVNAPTATSREPCAKSRSVTMAVNAQVRVYRLRASVFACYRRSGRTTFLDHTRRDELQEFTSVRVAGRFVGFDHGFGCDRHYGDCAGYVKVVDVRSGKRRHSFVTQDSRLAGEPPSQVPELSDFALRPNGSAALIIGPTEAVELEVWKLDSEGNTRLDHGPDVEPGSLATNGRWVYWRRGSAAFAGTLR